MSKEIWLGLFGGMLVGASIVLMTLLFYSGANQPINTLINPDAPAGQDTVQPTAAVTIDSQEKIETSGKNLCTILTAADINSLIPGANVQNSQSLADSNGQCAYFKNLSAEPFITFNNSLYSLATNKELAGKAGGEIKIINGIGDEAFFSKSTSMINNRNAQNLHTLAFRTDTLVFTITASELNESQLKTLASAAINKLTTQ